MSTRNLPLLVPPRKPIDPYATRWATVTSASPIRVRLDGDSSPLGITPEIVIPAVLAGDRVLLQIINRRICIVGRVATNIDMNGYVRAIRTSNTQGSFAAKLAADAGDRWTAYADGKLQWGDGTGSPQDVNLYRSGVSILTTDDEFKSNRGATNDGAFTAQINGDWTPRYAVRAGGLVEWGPGNATRDTNLYRAGANFLATDDDFQVRESLILRGENGTTFISFTSQTSAVVNVSFANAFPSQPNVFTNIASGAGATSGWESRAININTTGFQIFVYGSVTTWTSIAVIWQASVQ